MTLETVTLTEVRVGSGTSDLGGWFAPMYEATSDLAVAEGPSEERLALLQKLVELSSSDDSLDWDALARINIEGWGAEPDSE